MSATPLMIQASFTFSTNSVTIVFVNFLKPKFFCSRGLFAHTLVAAKSVFPKLATRDSHIAWWLYYRTERGM